MTPQGGASILDDVAAMGRADSEGMLGQIAGLADQVIDRSIPHMLMPTPGSPERFWDSLAGLAPKNYSELPPEDKELIAAGMKSGSASSSIGDAIIPSPMPIEACTVEPT